MIAYRPKDRIAALWPAVICWQNDQQIQVAVLAGFAAGVAAEGDDLFRIEALGNQLGYGLDGGSVDRGFDLIHATRFTMLFFGYLWQVQTVPPAGK